VYLHLMQLSPTIKVILWSLISVREQNCAAL
jgi:hypothetical protein